MRLELDEETHYESAPPSYRTAALGPVLYPLSQPIDMASGSTLTICGAHDRVALRVWPKAVYSSMGKQ
jgi:hypothetical protein